LKLNTEDTDSSENFGIYDKFFKYIGPKEYSLLSEMAVYIFLIGEHCSSE